MAVRDHLLGFCLRPPNSWLTAIIFWNSSAGKSTKVSFLQHLHFQNDVESTLLIQGLLINLAMSIALERLALSLIASPPRSEVCCRVSTVTPRCDVVHHNLCGFLSNCSAMPYPIDVPAPVTMATLSFNLLDDLHALRCAATCRHDLFGHVD